jgi:hypothetical protein
LLRIHRVMCSYPGNDSPGWGRIYKSGKQISTVSMGLTSEYQVLIA